ncbi:methyltransferase domain-containing protein [Propionimicrobium sp. PCR01-08-3]|uniref:protein-L-isoaspartate O-methyltransferase family protein n=1 Tax=Propionimicrobium sp. PCR01-08-3 TaxID=3052086 RepID=UPI00255D0ABF|nr:methyltransferase domain-containing protein [Propionimicrobium sp. PCR01-08-3]WIY82937.1 methyltransferase domain-containing protein [Propionimicrobium sp. PCR01-08-3]
MGDIKGAVTRAMKQVRREDFLPADARSQASIDAPIPVGDGQTNSQPSTVAIMLMLLDPQPGQLVLDVGSGSGWTTALLATLVGTGGRVIGVERQPNLVESARAALAKYANDSAEIRLAQQGILGLPGDGPFDRILVSAGARRLPDVLVDQLADGGVMVIPVNGVMLRVVRTGSDTTITEHGLFVFVPLIED